MCNVHPKLTQVIVDQTPRIMVALLVVSSIYVYIFMKFVPLPILIVWLSSQIMLAGYRWVNAKRLQKNLDEKDEKGVQRNEFLFLLSSIFQAATWTIASLLAVVYAPEPFELVTFVMVVGVVTAALLVMSAIYKAYVIFFILMMTPQLGILYYYGDAQHMGLFLFTLAYMPSIIVLSKALYDSRLESIRANDTLEENVQYLHELSITDTLTGIYNRRYFFEVSQNIVSIALREKKETTLLMLDIDHFKSVNDKYGHDAGDFILTSVTQEVSKVLRDSDIFARVGGEEFTVLLNNTSLDGAKIIAEKIRKKVDEKTFVYESTSLDLTISIGVATVDKEKVSIDALYKKADEQLYKAKESGRNRVC